MRRRTVRPAATATTAQRRQRRPGEALTIAPAGGRTEAHPASVPAIAARRGRRPSVTPERGRPARRPPLVTQRPRRPFPKYPSSTSTTTMIRTISRMESAGPLSAEEQSTHVSFVRPACQSCTECEDGTVRFRPSAAGGPPWLNASSGPSPLVKLTPDRKIPRLRPDFVMVQLSAFHARPARGSFGATGDVRTPSCSPLRVGSTGVEVNRRAGLVSGSRCLDRAWPIQVLLATYGLTSDPSLATARSHGSYN